MKKKSYKTSNDFIIRPFTLISNQEFKKIYKAAHLAAIAYDNDALRIKNWKSPKCSYFPNYVNSKDTQLHVWTHSQSNETLGYLILKKNKVIMSFKGCTRKSIQLQFLMDLSLQRMNIYLFPSLTQSPLRVCKTVLQQFLQLKSFLFLDWLPKIYQFYHSKSLPSTIWILGHSMGGSLATLIALQWLELQDAFVFPLNSMNIFLFNTPSFADANFISTLISCFPFSSTQRKLWNVIDYQDPVSQWFTLNKRTHPSCTGQPSTSFIFPMFMVPNLIWIIHTSMYLDLSLNSCSLFQPTPCCEFKHRIQWKQLVNVAFLHTRFLDQAWFFGSKGNNNPSFSFSLKDKNFFLLTNTIKKNNNNNNNHNHNNHHKMKEFL